ncbi:BZ3500_MvSof-1268-A1-R1_Chr7-3g09691 [Microbotryum saponariae]|uniref:BZ3500_MvSof-1268-A1-R1_Chr7-3g09691 protein n=1 Tax=Microbotryum saponariae TaxID=289078 RepID=A0A2X0KZX2_9BASI|nr:BZ3501_MvSof-1269-A2-R1_Chr7-2g09414 [Microbotryum saponariae]SDA02423.1 BZ3500_MvSof-1268-A1-R1_Chr7-3g09691 [Microbotryum saponariae]
MKYSIVFVALVVMATVNVLALPAVAIKPTSEIDEPYTVSRTARVPNRPRNTDFE